MARRCELLDVSRSGYYAAQRRPASARGLVNQQLVVEMRRIHREVDRTYGSPRMHPELVGAGFACGRHRVARLMRAAGIRAKQANQYCVTTDSRHRFAIAPNHLDRAFSAPAPNRVWMGDMTYIPTAEGWCFLAVLIDAFSRRGGLGGGYPALGLAPAHGVAASGHDPSSRARPHASLRPRHPVCLHRLPDGVAALRSGLQYEPERGLLG